jgi:hypothetical protein
MTDAAPSGALPWASAAKRNRKLIPWRPAISMTFAERPRCLRVAWELDGLFNGKSGYAYPVNADLANMSGLPINKVQGGLLALETDGAILRIAMPHESDTDMADVLVGHASAYRRGQHGAA